MWLKSTKMEARRCVRQSRDAHEAIPEPSEGDGHPRLTVSPAPRRRSEHGDQGQEHEEEHGKEAGSKDAERKAAGQEGEEVAGPGDIPQHWPAKSFRDEVGSREVAALLIDDDFGVGHVVSELH